MNQVMSKRPVYLTLEDVVEFILNNRNDIVFKNWTVEQLVEFLEDCLDKNLLFYSTDGEGRLTGIVTVMKREPFKLYISHALTTTKGDLGKDFFKKLFIFWPSVKFIEADRHGKTHEYNVRDLKRKLKIV